MKDELGNEVTDERIEWIRQELRKWPGEPGHRMEAQLVLEALLVRRAGARDAMDLALGYILACSRQGETGATLTLELIGKLDPEVGERLAAIQPVPRQERQG